MTEIVDTARVRAAHERFVTTGQLSSRAVRSVVADSWRRSQRSGVDPEVQNAPVDMGGNDLTGYRSSLALAAAMPVVRDLLVAPGHDAGWVTALTDDTGRMLWVEGDQSLRRRVEGVGFVEGGVWREDSAGTNALGTALVTDQPVQVVEAEHYARKVQPWNCTAVPIHAASGQVLGVLDVTGGPTVATGLVMALVRATVAAVEAELRIASLESTVRATLRRSRMTAVPAPRPTRTPLTVLGERRPRLGAVELSPRHAEILTLLAWHPRGLGAERLASLVYESEASPVTLRAELVRLRRVLEGAGEPPLESRPYRLGREVDLDAASVAKLLAQGSLKRAAERYAGPVLPASTAPGIVELRDELAGRLRESMLSDASPEVLAAYAERDECRYDAEVWRALLEVLPPRSPRRASVVAHLERIEAALR